MPARSLRSRIGTLVRRTRSAPVATVDVVVVVEPVDRPRLDAALRSVTEQGYAGLRVHVCELTDAEPTWQAAANAGVAAGRGDFVVLLRGCDLLAPDAIRLGVTSLVASGSVLCSGRLDQAGAPEPWLLRAQRRGHAVARTGHPSGGGVRLPVDLTLGGTMIRRSAWSPLDDDEDWLLSATVARLLAGAGAADLLVEPTYTWHPDHGTRAYGATPSALPGLGDRAARMERIGAILGAGVLAERWRRTVAGIEVPRLLQDTERADEDEWRRLRELAAAVTAHDRWWVGVGAAARALLWLAAEGRRADLELVAADVAALGEDLRTQRSGAAVLAEWPVPGIPDEIRELPRSETGLATRVSRVGPPGPDRRADLLLAIDHVDLADPQTRVVVHDGRGSVVDVAPIDPAEASRWFGRRFQAATAVSVLVPGARATRLRVTVSAGELTRTARAHLPARVPPLSTLVVVEDLAVEDGALVVTGSGDLGRVRLLGRGDRPVAAPTEVRDGQVRIDLAADLFGDLTALAPGSYRVVAGTENLAVSEQVRGRLPEVQVGSRHRVRAHLGPRGGLVIELGAPLSDDEAGPYAQQQLQTEYAATDRPVDPDLFYFESYAGRTATDSPRAIFEELRRRRPGLRALWGIADSGQRVPDGAVPVLLRSRAWYDALASAGVIVMNTDTEVWFRRRPGQVLLQTFHGYPSKAMGRSQWEAKDYPPSVVREFRARGVDTWSAILSPTPEMTRHYREQYDYDGPAFERGYPRDDDLTAPGADARREAMRDLLGIGADQRAVLYAPTWRDHLASRPRAAAMTDHLDLAQAADGLGPGFVVLLRGHRFHTPPPVAGAARIVDVTAYPEINDLILAADVAVLDYSSLRFDFALTGRPMVFLVPDLEEYGAGSRRFLFPFEDSAPGPFVDDTAEVVAALRDPGLAAEWAPRIAAFNARYQPYQDGRASERVVDALLALRG